jgi:hypothetical protein
MIDEFQRALADGPDVEMFRLRQVCNIWNIDLAELSERGCEDLAAKFEVALYQLAGDSLSEDKQFDPAMSAEDRLRMCSGLSAFLASKLKRKEITDPVLRETAQRITDSLSYREALIYRDWQDAIGDAMIEKDEASTRRYRVIGFEAFEELLKHDSPWIKTLGRSVDDIDFERRDQNDFRHPQLKKLAGAVAGIVLAIDQSPDGDLVDTATANVAKRLLPAEKAA